MNTTHITIDRPGLTRQQIPVMAHSTVELVEYTPEPGSWTAQPYYALLVDGRHYTLILWKHTVGRPEMLEALNATLAQVTAAITALGSWSTEPCPSCDGSGVYPNGHSCVVCAALDLTPWQCATCAETDPAARRTDAHPELCRSCPVRRAERQDTDRYIVVVSSVDGEPYSWRYTRTEAGERRAAIKLAQLVEQGYTLKV